MSDFLSMPLGTFIDAASSGSPVPGGGGVAALAGALGGAMASMAANFTLRPKFAEHEGFIRDALDSLAPIIASLKKAVDDDAVAFSGISTAYKLPKKTDRDIIKRKLAIDNALLASMRVPAQVATDCMVAAEFLPELAQVGNPNLLSDVEVAAIMLAAAAAAARVNVLVNSSQLTDPEARDAEDQAAVAVKRTAMIAERVTAIVKDRTMNTQ